MSVAFEKLEGLKRQLTIEVPAEAIQEAVQSKINRIAKTAKIPGFRPGKAPMKVLMQHYGENAKQEALGDVLNKSYVDALKAENINPAGMPQIDIKQFELGKPLQYTAVFEVIPEVELKEMDGQAVDQFESTLEEKDITNAIEAVQKQRADWKEVKRAAKLEDRVTIDFEGFIDDQPFEGGKAEKYSLVLGSKTMIPGFEDEIIGIKKDEERDINVTFPKDYQSEELKGKAALFKIKAHTIEAPKLPELDDDFANKYFGIKEGGMAALKEKLKDHLAKELDNGLKAKNKNAVLDKFMELNPITIPQVMIDDEATKMAEQAARRYAPDPKNVPTLPKELFAEQAKKRVHLGLLLAEFVKKHEIKSNDDRIKALLQEMVATHETPDQVIKWYFEDRRRLAEFEMLDIENQVVEKMLEQAKVSQQKISFEELKL